MGSPHVPGQKSDLEPNNKLEQRSTLGQGHWSGGVEVEAKQEGGSGLVPNNSTQGGWGAKGGTLKPYRN